MNIHHLELFYYVATHGGISRAVRHIPYGIQQPAVSSQMLRLEQDVGEKLFERTPFRLTSAGEKLYAYVAPFFNDLGKVADELRQSETPSLRIGAAELVLAEHLPPVIEVMRAKVPKLQFCLRSGFTRELETWVQDREIDLAITPLDGKPPAKVKCQRLMSLPLALLVPKTSKLKSAEELWTRDRIDDPLIALPDTELITRKFRQGLQKRKVDWPTSIEASSMGLVTRYVANGYGIGVNIYSPEIVAHPKVKVLPLPDFEPIEMAAMWLGEPTPLMQAFLEEAGKYAGKLAGARVARLIF